MSTTDNSRTAATEKELSSQHLRSQLPGPPNTTGRRTTLVNLPRARDKGFTKACFMAGGMSSDINKAASSAAKLAALVT